MTDLLMMGCVIAVQIAADTDWNTFLQKEKEHCASVLFLLSIFTKKDILKFMLDVFER